MQKEQLVIQIKEIINSKYENLSDIQNKLDEIIEDDELNLLLKNLFEDSKVSINQIELDSLSEDENIKKILYFYLNVNKILILDENGQVIDNDYDIMENKNNEEFFSVDIEKQYLHDIKKIPLLTVEEEKELAKKVNNGDEEALKKLIESNLRFVAHVARKYVGRGLSLIELIQEGSIGLTYAIKKFDVNRNVRLINYADYYIKREIVNAIRLSKNFKLSRYTDEIRKKLCNIK